MKVSTRQVEISGNPFLPCTVSRPLAQSQITSCTLVRSYIYLSMLVSCNITREGEDLILQHHAS